MDVGGQQHGFLLIGHVLLSEGIDEAVDSRELLFVHDGIDLFGNIPGVSLSAKSIFEFGVIGIVGAADALFAEVV